MSKLISFPGNNGTKITINVDAIAYWRDWGKKLHYVWGIMLRLYSEAEYKAIDQNGSIVRAAILAAFPTVKFIKVQSDYTSETGQVVDPNVWLNQENIFAIWEGPHDGETYTFIQLTTGFIIYSDTMIGALLDALSASPNPMKYATTQCFLNGIGAPTTTVYLVAGGVSDYQHAATGTDPWKIYSKYNQFLLTATAKATIDSQLGVHA